MKLDFRRLAVALALVSPLFTGAAARAARVVDRVVAVVNDDIILETELDQFAAPQYRGPDPETPEGKKAWDDIKRKSLEAMIDSKLIQEQASELKLAVTSEEVDRAIQQVKQQNKLDDSTFVEALKTQGYTMDSYRKSLRKQILELKVVSQAVRSRVSVGDEEVRTYYKQNEKALSGEDREVRLRQILIATSDKMGDDEIDRKKKVATKVVELAREGHPFADLAKQYTDDEGTKDVGGDLGFLAKGTLVDELDAAVQAMEPGDVRGPIRTARGWVILQLVERKAADIRPFEEVKEQLRKQLYDQQVEKAQQSWLKELRKKAHVEVRY
ncbi:MAG TPA: peptidylprolyl isomerase [Polyangia bacterium]|nr:peptidylprolyl isomerase [Polyangia bacterium]